MRVSWSMSSAIPRGDLGLMLLQGYCSNVLLKEKTLRVCCPFARHTSANNLFVWLCCWACRELSVPCCAAERTPVVLSAGILGAVAAYEIACLNVCGCIMRRKTCGTMYKQVILSLTKNKQTLQLQTCRQHVPCPVHLRVLRCHLTRVGSPLEQDFCWCGGLCRSRAMAISYPFAFSSLEKTLPCFQGEAHVVHRLLYKSSVSQGRGIA